jgi:hypothetical protein
MFIIHSSLYFTTLHYTSLYFTTLHYTSLYFTTLHYTSLHFTTLHCSSLHFTTLHRFLHEKAIQPTITSVSLPVKQTGHFNEPTTHSHLPTYPKDAELSSSTYDFITTSFKPPPSINENSNNCAPINFDHLTNYPQTTTT